MNVWNCVLIVSFFAFSENITAFSWEPVGNKFAVIHGDSPHINVSFYGIKHGGTVSLLSKSSTFLCHYDN